MDELPGELIAHIYHHSTPNRRKALLAVNRHVTRSIRLAVTSCTADASDVKGTGLALTTTPCRRWYPKLAIVQLRLSRGQLVDFFGTFVTFELPPDGALLRASFASLATFRHSCLVLGPTLATFHLTSALQCLAAGCIVGRCPTLREASFVRADAIAQSLAPIISDTLQVLRLYGLGCDRVATKNLRKLVIYNNATTATIEHLPAVVKVKLLVHRLADFDHTWLRLERLRIVSWERSTISLAQLPALRRLDLTNVDVRCRNLLACSPRLEEAILENSRFVSLTPGEAVDQMLSLPKLDSVSVELGGVAAGEQDAWSEALARLSTLPHVRLSSSIQPGFVILFARLHRTQ